MSGWTTEEPVRQSDPEAGQGNTCLGIWLSIVAQQPHTPSLSSYLSLISHQHREERHTEQSETEEISRERKEGHNSAERQEAGGLDRQQTEMEPPVSRLGMQRCQANACYTHSLSTAHKFLFCVFTCVQAVCVSVHVCMYNFYFSVLQSSVSLPWSSSTANSPHFYCNPGQTHLIQPIN